MIRFHGTIFSPQRDGVGETVERFKPVENMQISGGDMPRVCILLAISSLSACLRTCWAGPMAAVHTNRVIKVTRCSGVFIAYTLRYIAAMKIDNYVRSCFAKKMF